MAKNQNPEKKYLRLIMVLSSAFVVIFAICATIFYQYIYLPNKVADSLRENTEILNEAVKESNDTINHTQQLSLVTENSVDSTELAGFIDEAKDIQTQTIELFVKLENRIEDLNYGPNNDSREYALMVKDNLDKRLALVQKTKNSLDVMICTQDKMFNFITKLELVVENIRLFSTLTNENQIILNLNNSAQTIDDANQDISSIVECFDEDSVRYYNNIILTDLNSDNELYQKFADLLRKLATSIEQKDNNQGQTTTEQIIQVANQKSKLREKGNIRVAFETINQEIKMEIENLEKQELAIELKKVDIIKQYKLKQ